MFLFLVNKKRDGVTMDPRKMTAAYLYHGKLNPPQKQTYKMELEALVQSFDKKGTLIPGEDYILENVGGKLISENADLITYRIVFHVSPCDFFLFFLNKK